jgi:outer membrane protein OmpA-like peptidoglycan-associated protein
MKSGTRFIFSLILLLIPALGYSQGVSGEFHITNKAVTLDKGRVSVVLEISASHLITGDNASLELFPVLRSGGNERLLPGIGYRGDKYQDAENGDLFFKIYQDIRDDKVIVTPYNISIPYENWMDNASLEFRQYMSKDGKYIELPARQMITQNNLYQQAASRYFVKAEPDQSAVPSMVQFLEPQAEKLKMCCTRSSVNIDFPVGRADVLAGYGNNTAELRKVDALMRSILTDSLITVNTITITGYSSPEGSYAVNERLSLRRSEGLKKYLTANYPLKTIPVYINWVALDWEEIGRLVEDSDDIVEKEKVLDIIHNPDIPPGKKDARLQQIIWWSENYKIIFHEMYPQFRRAELRIDYTMRPLSDSEVKVLYYSHPETLSLEEIMRAASLYEPGTEQYREACETAAKYFPDDVAAANNAAAAALLAGDVEAASRHLGRVEKYNDKRTLVNRGVISYIAGDVDGAVKYFAEAGQNGIAKGYGNLQQIDTDSNYKRNKLLADAQVNKDYDRDNALVNKDNALVNKNYERDAQTKLGRVEPERTYEPGMPLFAGEEYGGKPRGEGYRFAVKTNLLYDAVLLPNVAVELPVGQQWSVEIEGQLAWWNTKVNHNSCWRIQTIGVEARRWLGNKTLTSSLKGHYLGVYGMAGTYDIKFRDKDGHLSDMSYSAGISYGYSLPVSRRFNFEFGIAVGYLGGKYKDYDQYDVQNGIFPLIEKKNLHYFGPTKAKVSLVWIIGGGGNK